MKHRILYISCLTLAATIMASHQAPAATVYQWTDEEGTVHFSDAPPKDNPAVEIQELDYPAYTSSVAVQDEYSIFNQLERMTEWRKQAQDERMARKKLELEEKRLAQEQHANRYNVPASRKVYEPVYYYPYSGLFGGFNRWHDPHWGHISGSGKKGSSYGFIRRHRNQISVF